MVRPGDDANVAVLAGVDAPGGAAVAPVAHTAIFLARVAELHQRVFQDVGGVFGDGHIDLLALAGLLGVHKRGHGSGESVLSRAQLGQRHALSQWLLLRLSGDIHQSADGVEVQLRRLPVAVGAGLAKVGDRRHHQSRVGFLQVVIRKPQTVHAAGGEILRQDVSLGG